jgi:benzoate-CoA ligase family protein
VQQLKKPEANASLLDLPTSFNVATRLVDGNLEQGRAERIAIECGDEQATYRQLFERVNRTGNLLKQIGVREEERVAILLLDTPEFLYAFLGAIKIGAVAVPLNTLLQPQEYEFLLNETRARVAIVHEALYPQLENIPRQQLRFLQQTIVVGDTPTPPTLSYQQLLQGARPELDPFPTTKDDPAFWLFSSGSTGSPKACVHLHHDMIVSSEAYAKSILNMNENDRCYSVARLFFAYGLGNAGYFPLYCGATTILSPIRPVPARIFADIERYRPTLFFSVPSNYAALLAHPPLAERDFDFSSVRHAISAGEALPAPLWERFQQRFGVEILDALGSTEALHMVISNRPGEVRPGSSGKILPGFDAKIVDDEGNPLPPGEIGSLLVKADSVCSGYWNQHGKTKQTFNGDWFRTGDKYYQDDDGFFWYAGRGDDLFKVNGKWLSPTDVESVLIAHPAVLEAAIVAREDHDGLLKPAAYVVLHPDHPGNDQLISSLQNWVADNAGAYKRPRWVEFLPELPKTATGKLQRFKLRQLHPAPSTTFNVRV